MKMKLSKLVVAAAGLSMVVWGATPAFAGHGHGHDNAFAFGKAENHGGGQHFEDSGNSHGNKHGEYRSLERANDVAGTHGQKGRNGAASHQSEGGSSHGNHDE
jgi:hypothetical protein